MKKFLLAARFFASIFALSSIVAIGETTLGKKRTVLVLLWDSKASMIGL